MRKTGGGNAPTILTALEETLKYCIIKIIIKL